VVRDRDRFSRGPCAAHELGTGYPRQQLRHDSAKRRSVSFLNSAANSALATRSSTFALSAAKRFAARFALAAAKRFTC